MVKRRLAIIFLFLVNIVLLAHIIIPHHHHDGAICISENHCQEHGDKQEHNCLASGHDNNQHQDKKSGDCCSLKEPVPVTRHFISFKSDFQVKKDSHVDYQIAFFHLNLSKPHFFNLPFLFTEYCFSGYSHTPEGNIGLRGPPIV